MSLVIDFSAIDGTMLATVGGKAANLGELTRAGLPVPQGFCVTTDAYRAVALGEAGVRGGKSARIFVNMGTVGPCFVEDMAPELAAGDTVLLGSAQGVTPGSRVRVLQEEAERLYQEVGIPAGEPVQRRRHGGG